MLIKSFAFLLLLSSCGILSVKSDQKDFNHKRKDTKLISKQVYIIPSYEFKYSAYTFSGNNESKDWSEHPFFGHYPPRLEKSLERKLYQAIRSLQKGNYRVTTNFKEIDKSKEYLTIKAKFKEVLDYKKLNAAAVGLTFGAVSQKQPIDWEVKVVINDKEKVVKDIIRTEARNPCSTYFGCGNPEISDDMIDLKTDIVMRMYKKAVIAALKKNNR